ncbi:hypothetical protein BDY21DRAFT_133508 [Lineolata rhizophorae]|uniref:Uncharacterized protein n=1 Tax=Lineolata rhizophorae TaxID=578093 RepID=A0A6A6PA80_9PEZI|nr:hypothetical protein BDY21DRAFT_133508 [Lineolata rhizophorae]
MSKVSDWSCIFFPCFLFLEHATLMIYIQSTPSKRCAKTTDATTCLLPLFPCLLYVLLEVISQIEQLIPLTIYESTSETIGCRAPS